LVTGVLDVTALLLHRLREVNTATADADVGLDVLLVLCGDAIVMLDDLVCCIHAGVAAALHCTVN
jgi:hypothetical protein